MLLTAQADYRRIEFDRNIPKFILYDATFDREFIKFVTLREESKNSTFTFHAFKLSDK